MICANGLTIPDSIYHAPTVKHTKNLVDDVKQATMTVLTDFPKLIGMQESLSSVELSQDERMLLGDAAADIFFTREDRARNNKAAFRNQRLLLENQLISAVRYDDRKMDLWTVSNVIQENLIRGNVRVITETGDLRSQRKVTSIDRDNDIHAKLFMLTQKFAELKGVKIGLTA